MARIINNGYFNKVAVNTDIQHRNDSDKKKSEINAAAGSICRLFCIFVHTNTITM